MSQACIRKREKKTLIDPYTYKSYNSRTIEVLRWTFIHFMTDFIVFLYFIHATQKFTTLHVLDNL